MSYRLDSFVNRQEANALKEMIFQRVRERSEAMTDDVQADVMDLARESFVSNNNPFSQIINRPSETTKTEENVDKVEISSKQEEIEGLGFPVRELKARAVDQERTLQEQIVAATVNNTMQEAREKLTNKKSFMGALDFLNSQAAMSLMKTRADRFEVIG